MIVRLDNVLPQLLCPAIENYCCSIPMEYLGDLYGYWITNPSKEKTCVVTDALHYHTPYADEDQVELMKKDEKRQLLENLDDLLEDHKVRLGDFHSHVKGRGIEDAYAEATQAGFIHQFQTGVKYSNEDVYTMKKTGEMYMIIGFGERKFAHKRPFYRCPDGKSLFGVTKDFVFALAVWKFDKKSYRFTKAKVVVNGNATKD